MALRGPGIVSLGSRKPGLTIFKTTSAPAFDPLSLSPAAWYKADAGLLDASDAAITVDATAIKTWQDQSGNAHHLTQGTAAQRPLMKASIQNSKNVVRFDGINDTLKTASFTLSQPDTWFVVCRYNSAFSANGTVLDGLSAAFSHLIGRRSSTVMQIYAGTTLTGGATTPQSWHTYAAVFNGASSQIFADGTATAAAGNAGAANATGIWVGSNSDFSEPAGVDVGEVLVYSGALSQANRNLVEGYLKGRWGTP